MPNYTLEDEKRYLQKVIAAISSKLEETLKKISLYGKNILESKEYLWQNIYELDPMEIVSIRQDIEETVSGGDNSVAEKSRLERLIKTPFFGKIVFRTDSEDEDIEAYIGIYTFLEGKTQQMLIYDWRAPISSMFYDFETGIAFYDAPLGRIEGSILQKRQYKIRNGIMEYMLESSLNIDDEVLQKVLSQTSDNKMHNIVTTIQREQNAIIRNVSDDILIIQGVAGSGKTSIALHRIAYLLYRYKGKLGSKNVLIISPNKVFSNYISNVLPELGEETILESEMDEIAKRELPKKYRAETSYEQAERLSDDNDNAYILRIKYKATYSFLEKLEQFIKAYLQNCFKPKDLKVGDYLISADFLLQRYKLYEKEPLLKRIPKILKDVEAKVTNGRFKLNKAAINLIKASLMESLDYTSIFDLYESFYTWLGKREMLIIGRGNKIEYSDVFPMIYISMHIEGFSDFSYIKHLIVDEMQDYTPIQYAVLSILFRCNKTILGDTNQALNPYSVSKAEEIQKVFKSASIIKLLKSYRSTYEIINFAKGIIPDENVIAVERHGDTPRVINCHSTLEELMKIIATYRVSAYSSLGIVCKDQRQAKRLYYELKKRIDDVELLSTESLKYNLGINVASVHTAKGLEFDQVVVPYCDMENYHTDLDKGLLYIACTRAMHKLDLLYEGSKTVLINEMD